jgi:uncharacterized protein (TIGR03435 family)
MKNDSGMRRIQVDGRFACCTLTAVLVFAVTTIWGQSPAPVAPSTIAANAPLTYDVVSIKQNNSGSMGNQYRTDVNSLRAWNMPLKMLLANAYGVNRMNLIFGLPGWADAARFDIDAKVTDPDKGTLDKLTDKQKRAMLQAILEDRFLARVHWETREMPIYELVIAKGGPKFKDTSPESAEGKALTSQRLGKESMSINNREMSAYGVRMGALSGYLSQELQRTVVDRTGLTGNYDFTLKWAPEDPAAENLGDKPTMMTALQEQLGLKLQPGRGPVETLVIDHAEMPTEN